MSKDFFSSRLADPLAGATSSSTSASSPAARVPYRRHPTSLVKTIYMPNKTSMQVVPQGWPPAYHDLLMPSYRAQPALATDEEMGQGEDFTSNARLSQQANSNLNLGGVAGIDVSNGARVMYPGSRVNPAYNAYPAEEPSSSSDESENVTAKVENVKLEMLDAKERQDSAYRRIVSGCAAYLCLGVFSGIISYLSLELILAITDYKSYHIQLAGTTKLLADLCTAVSAAALGLSVSALTTASLHVYMTLKATKLSNEHERVLHYMQQGVYLRFITSCGTFVGAPLILTGAALYIAVHSGLILRTVVGVVLGIAIILCLLAILQTMYFWIFNRDKYMTRKQDTSRKGDQLQIDAKLSTLV